MRQSIGFVVVVFVAFVGGCSPASEDPVDGDLSGLDGVPEADRDRIEQLFGDHEGRPGWPDYPRRVGSITNEFKNETTFTVGASGSFFDLVEAEASASLVLGLGHRTNLMLIKHAPGGTVPLTRNDGGTIYVAYEEGVDFVGMCTYTVFLDVGTRFLGKVKLAGNGIENQTDFGNQTESFQSTNFFRVNEGDTVTDLEALCESAFDREIRHSVAADLRNLALARLSVDGQEVDQLYHGLRGALYGPEREGLLIMGEEWEVEPATWFRSDRDEQRFIVTGELTRDATGPFNDDVQYTFEYEDGVLVHQDVGVDDSDDWHAAARELAELIGNEVHREFRVGLHNLDPGAPLMAAAYVDVGFDGEPTRFGVGHYNGQHLEELGLDDEISALDIPAGLRMVAYEDDDLEGTEWVLTGSMENVGDEINDEITSFKIEIDPDYVRPYAVQAPDGSRALALGGNGATAAVGADTRWHLEHVETGYYTLAEQDSAEPLTMGDATTAEASQWALVQAEEVEGEQYYLIQRESRLALTRDGDALTLASPDGSEAQRWQFD